MAHARFLSVVALPLALGSCSDPAPKRADSAVDLNVKPATPPTPFDAKGWGKFHSKRFNVTLPLPDGKAWKIDDHRGQNMVATHEATSSRVDVLATNEEGLMNRARCEDRARALGLVPANDALFTTVDDEVWIGPEAYDSRVWVAIEAAKPGGGVTGHVFLFGSFVRKCLLVHYASTVPSAKDEEALATRLAVAQEKIVKAIALDSSRTNEDATLPKEKH